ncbi:hypothetical protein NP233_g3204 [Leucocoprinus birnbaumii]|uniref:Vacuolar membrane protein n=1 Tax=Leucocoprinus birnbaumii TaxID=56174 RepID=A0AAD5YYH9_9AGAR|nr:hypothetical protein NP233_g3204 [Leucocoprinus birnbaumii]
MTAYDAAPAGLLDDYPDVDNGSCKLLGPTALIVQGLMGVLVILSLIYKRQREKPKRPWRIWLFDVSKQVVGQMVVHTLNVFISHIGSGSTESNACVFYFLNILFDTTLGVALIYAILHVLTYLAKEKLGLRGFESGIYGSPPSIKYWARQAAIYVLALTTMKLLIVGLLALLGPAGYKLGEWLLSWTYTKEGDAVQVVFTMGIFPIIMNIVQFWLIDSIVKASNAIALDTSSSPSLDDPEHREPLFNAPSDDEDEDAYKPTDLENQRRDRHLSSSLDDGRGHSSSDPEEYKSTPSTSTPAAQDEHSYPPSLSSSVTSATSSTHEPPRTIRTAKNLVKKQRRGPPAPLYIRPVGQPAINSPQVSAQPVVASRPRTPEQQPFQTLPPTIAQHGSTNNNEWADSWEDSDDWATRVGEEEWTGRRLEDKRRAVNGVWETNNTTPSIGAR